MKIFDVEWEYFKTFCASKNLKMQYVLGTNTYHVLAFDQHYGIQADLVHGNPEALDFETNYQASANQNLTPAKNIYGELIVVAEKGNDIFDTVVAHDWTDTSTWPSVNNSQWEIGPSATNKILSIAKAEVQFCHNVLFASQNPPNEFYFDIWTGNPLFDPQQTPTADDPTFIPGQSVGNPLKFLYKRYTYKSIKDVFNFGNEHFTMPVGVDGLTTGITTVQFNYDQRIELRGDQYAVLRFSTKNHQPMGGSFFTVSLVVSEFDI